MKTLVANRQPPGDRWILIDDDFDNIVNYAQEVYYKRIMNETPVGIEGEA